MMKDFFKKLSKQQEPEELDTGYASDYYDSSYAQPTRTEELGEENEDRGYGDSYRSNGYSTTYDEPDARGYREPTYRPNEKPVVEEAPPAPVNAGTLYYTPETYRDCREAIVAGLAESHVVVVNVRLLETEDTLRLFDYILGAVQALDAEMTRLNATTMLLSPKDLEVTEDDLRSLFAPRKAEAEEAAEAEEETDGETTGGVVYINVYEDEEDLDT